jgi:hypothetical protein
MASVLEEKDAIHELQARYCFHFDLGAFDDWIELFTPDGAFDVGPMGRFEGHPGLRDFLKHVPLTEGLPLVKHCVMNSIVGVDGANATAQSYVVVISAGPPLGLTLAGRYEERLLKTPHGWRFRERRVHFDLFHGR